MMIFKVAVVHQLEFLKFDICGIWRWLIVEFHVNAQNFAKIWQYTAELWPKTFYNMAAVHHIEFKCFEFGHKIGLLS